MIKELSKLGSQKAFQEKIKIEKQQEIRLAQVIEKWDKTGGGSFKEFMKENGYRCLPRNRYEDLILVLSSEQSASNIYSI